MNTRDVEPPPIIAAANNKFVECVWNILDDDINLIDSIGSVYQLFSWEYSKQIIDRMNCTLEEAYNAIACYLQVKTRPTVPSWGLAREYRFDVIFENAAKLLIDNGASYEEKVAMRNVFNAYLESKKISEF